MTSAPQTVMDARRHVQGDYRAHGVERPTRILGRRIEHLHAPNMSSVSVLRGHQGVVTERGQVGRIPQDPHHCAHRD
jgi:hypothetical protein